jgi:iron complex outermembrane receptor protein
MRIATGFIIATSLIGGAPDVRAQEAETGVDEIIVVGQKREERLRDAPLSATVLDAQAIEDARITSLRDLDDYAPNVSFNQLGQIGGTYLTIRGVESNPFIVNRAAIYIDGIPFRELDDQALGFAESVEILRGPQSTLYGANSESGAALVRTRGPSDVFRAEMRGDVSTFDNGEGYAFAAYLGGPLITDRLAGSLTVSADQADSFVRNIASSINEPGEVGSVAGTARLRWTPDARWTVNLLAQARRLEAPGLYEQEFPALNVAAYNEAYAATLNGGRRADRFTLVHDAPKNTEEDEWVIGAEAVHDMTWADLTLVASYREKDEDSRGTDLDLTAASFAAGANINSETFLNLEARLSSPAGAQTAWLLGVNYYADSRDQTLATLVGPGGLADYRRAPTQSREGQDIAIFAQLTHPLAERVRVTLGARAEQATRRRSQAAGVLDLGFVGVFTFAQSNLEADYTRVLPRVALDWRPTDDLTLYTSLAQGWIPGGFNLEAIRGTPTEAFSAYDPETLWSGEVGFKLSAFDGRAFFSGALFRIEADNWQEYNVLVDSAGRVISTNLITSNAEIAITGGELEVIARPIDGLDLRAGLGVSDAAYERYRFSAVQDLSGNDVKLVPKYDVNLSATYRFGTGFFLRGEANGQGEMPLNAENTATQASYVLLGAQIGYETDRFSIRVFGENLTDERYAAGSAYSNFLFGADGTFYAALGAPRVIGVEATARW